jgi:preprotein translocase subunit SecB
MKQIRPTDNKNHWPRNRVKSVECRKKDLVIRITDWMKDKDEPAFDVEVYIGGVYDYNESATFTMHQHKSAEVCKRLAITFAQEKVAAIL